MAAPRARPPVRATAANPIIGVRGHVRRVLRPVDVPSGPSGPSGWAAVAVPRPPRSYRAIT